VSGPDAPLPLFPLGAVLFPGLVLPLHVFEDRYRALVRALLREPEPARRVFGVVAIRRGSEVGQEQVDLYDVGCTAHLRTVAERADGTFAISAVGRQRYAIEEILPSRTPYLQASVRLLPEQLGPDGMADALGPRVLAALRAYLRATRQGPERGAAAREASWRDASGRQPEEQLPDDPLLLSHLVAATVSLDLADRQALLAAPDVATRLRDELRLLQRETALLTKVRAVPASLSDLKPRPGPN
jgi:Lon protease-like protein